MWNVAAVLRFELRLAKVDSNNKKKLERIGRCVCSVPANIEQLVGRAYHNRIVSQRGNSHDCLTHHS